MPTLKIRSEQEAVRYLTSEFIKARDVFHKSTAPSKCDDLERADVKAIEGVQKSSYIANMSVLEKDLKMLTIVPAAMTLCMQQAQAAQAITQRILPEQTKQEQISSEDSPRPKF